jgi:hypothetical protein
MYVIEDRIGPTIGTFVNNSKVRNTIFRHWPQTTVNGVEVFARLFVYNGGVVDTPATKKLYPLLNTSAEALRKESYEGVENVFLYFKPPTIAYSIAVADIEGYIETYSPIVANGLSDWYEFEGSYEPIVPLAEDSTDADIIAMVLNPNHGSITFETEQYNDVSGEVDIVNHLAGITLMDTASAMFEKEVTVTYRQLVAKEKVTTYKSRRYRGTVDDPAPSWYIDSVNFKVRYRRKTEVTDPTVDALLLAVKARTESIDDVNDAGGLVGRMTRETTYLRSSLNSINKTLDAMYEEVTTFTEDDLSYPFGGHRYLKVQGMRDLKVKDFIEILPTIIKDGHTKKKVKWWKKALAFALLIVTIIFAIITSPVTFGGSWAAVGAVLTIGILVQVGLGLIFAANGDYGAAMYTNKYAKVLGVLSAVTGIGAILTSWKQAAIDVALEAGRDAATTQISDYIVAAASKLTGMVSGGVGEMSTTQIVTNVLKAADFGFNAWKEGQVENWEGDLASKEQQIKKQEEELNALNPNTINLVERYVSDPYWNEFEHNSQMQTIYKMKSHYGQCQLPVSKWYT